jgi:MYXO-CTERM domain-containing protein
MNPQGVSHDDCVADAVLGFDLVLSGFDGSQNVQVWASSTGDCTQPADRGVGASAATCWLLPAGGVGINAPTSATYAFEIRVQDLVGSQNAPPYPPSYHQRDASACEVQPTYAAVPLNVAFLPLDASNVNVVGTPYVYTVATDLVGPPAPVGVTLSLAGDKLTAGWQPNTDADTAAYDLFFASSAAGAAGACQPGAQPVGVTGGGIGVTVADEAVGTYDLGTAESGTQAGVVVAAVDAFGNVGPRSAPVCDAVGNVSPASGGEAKATGGCACSTTDGGAVGGGGVLLLGIALTCFMRRRTRKPAN